MPRIAAFGGAYANPYAVEAMLADARMRGCAAIFNLGDLGGFGAECDAIWPLVSHGGVESIAGNYDIAIGRGDPDCGCGYADPRDNRLAQIIYDHTRAHTSADFSAWMRELPLELRRNFGGIELHMVHGSPLTVNDFLWDSMDDDELRRRLDASGADVLLCTHTGLPWQRRIDGALVVNVGAVGRPANDGSTDTRYAVLDIEDGAVRAELVRVDYDWAAQAASMRAAGLPEAFVETIETGWWTTCLEIVPPRERSRGRFHVYRGALPAGVARSGLGWADSPAPAVDGLPVMSMFGSAVFPPRLWLYTNFNCNLACDYCVVASSPQARARAMSLQRFRTLVDEAVDEGFAELYLTGGEPFVHPEILAMIEYACARLETVVLTNAMLFRGRRLRDLERLASLSRLTLQSSIDGARPETHDRWRGEGSWARAIEGIELAGRLGLPLRVAMTETPDNHSEVAELRRLLEGIGVQGDAFAVRPLVQRGFAADRQVGMAITDAVMVPELTISADGAHWHPVGADVDAAPDFVLGLGEIALAEAKRRVIERFLVLRREDGSLPDAFHCAV
ncbi:MAG: hypothetical protein NVSMB25_02850 [Thermoleophilaceae bacterium]